MEKVPKDIWMDNSRSVKNLPKESPSVGKTSREYCERLMRGDQPLPSAAKEADGAAAAAAVAGEAASDIWLQVFAPGSVQGFTPRHGAFLPFACHGRDLSLFKVTLFL